MASKLRQSGWRLPASVPDSYSLRVYDTRLEPSWLRGLLAELGLGGDSLSVIGGDFLLPPAREDAIALQSGRLERWGPDGEEPYNLVVPPRPHLAVWMQRARQQLAIETLGTRLVVAAIVPRDRCPQQWDLSSLRWALPQAECVLDDPLVEVRVVAVGERPPVVRVPAGVTELPPPSWENALLPSNRVLLCVVLRRVQGSRASVTCGWVRGPVPSPPSEDLELLRLECVLPPATKAASGEKALRAAVRAVASAIGQTAPSPAQLRQVQVAHGVAYALLGVPRDAACSWLRGSGCGGLYIRPFWTTSSGPTVARTQFALLWLRGKLENGPKLWDALQLVPGFYGLVATGKDLAVRVSHEADRLVIQSQVQFILGGAAALRSAEPGLRWWRLGPLSDAEMWRVKDLIAETGLQLARADFRVARMGPFRSAVYFAASGEPARTSLDDGSWSSSEARLSPAGPPPRQKGPGAALTPKSTWGGPRPVVSAASPPVAQPQAAAPPAGTFPELAQLSTPTVTFAASPGVLSNSVTFPPLVAADTTKSLGERGKAARKRGGRGLDRSGTAVATAPAVGGAASGSTAVELQLAALVAQVGALSQEIRELRRENVELRRQLDVARGVQQHQPYAVASLPPLPAPEFTPVRPASQARPRIAAELSPESSNPPAVTDATGEVVMASVSTPVAAERKKGRRLDMGVVDLVSVSEGPARAASEAPISNDA